MKWNWKCNNGVWVWAWVWWWRTHLGAKHVESLWNSIDKLIALPNHTWNRQISNNEFDEIGDIDIGVGWECGWVPSQSKRKASTESRRCVRLWGDRGWEFIMDWLWREEKKNNLRENAWSGTAASGSGSGSACGLVGVCVWAEEEERKKRTIVMPLLGHL